MAQIFQEDGKAVPITLIEAGPVFVTQIKNKEKDGYEAVQIGYQKKSKIKNQKLKSKEYEYFREFKSGLEEYKSGDSFDISVFEEGDVVKVSGLSKGKGFQGAVKRHGFRGMPSSHGHKHVKRHVGSIGQRFPQHTLKGMRMAGHMGNERITTRGLKIVKIDKDNNLLVVKGAVPGRKGTLLEITSNK